MEGINKIVFTGPESTGKTTLTDLIETNFQIGKVEEYARTYLNSLNRPYVKADLDKIKEQQIFLEDHQVKPMVCDTDLLTLIIWKEEVYQEKDKDWLMEYKSYQDRFYILLSPDIPWEPDPLRENPSDRYRLFDIYHQYVTTYHKPYEIVAGNFEVRIEKAKKIVSDILNV